MTHPTDDEIMSLAVRYLGEHAAHASTGLHRFARALLVEQARTQTPVGYVALDYYSPGNHLFTSFSATRNTEHDWKPVYLNAGQS